MVFLTDEGPATSRGGQPKEAGTRMIPGTGPGRRRLGHPLRLAVVAVTAPPVPAASVTAVSTASITVKNADGFTKTYQVTSSTLVDAQRDGIGSVRDGHQVSVLAAVSGGTATATHIEDLSLLPAGHPGPFPLGPGSMPG